MTPERTFLLALTLCGACSHGPAEHARGTTPHRDRDATSASGGSDESHATAAETRREAEAPTAMDQSSEPSDVEITRRIRSAVVGDSALSFAAMNVVIVTVSAVVTLRGDVGTESERRAIYAHARGAEGVARVENLIVVTP